ncbi:MAG: cation diffusion facilitator family transporter, partial [Patescibacteria group bacterium]|nr:cation diffusion facilitator family transporter [Patescibacteria group bacterium]
FAIVGLAVSLADALILYFFGKYEIKVGKEINAESLIAMGKENRTHLFSSMTVFVGILATYKQIPYVEGVTTIIISLFIFQIGLETLKKSIFALMDVAPDEEIEKKVIKIIESSAEIEEFFDLRLRKSGPFIFGEVKVGVRRFIDIKKSYEISSKIEKKIKKQMPEIKSFNVQVEPFKSDWQHLVIPVLDNNGLNSKISDKFSRAPYFLFINTEKKKVKGFYILKNSYLKNEKKVGLSVAKMITKQKSDILITKQIGKIALYALKENLMDIHMTKSNTVKEAIEDSLQGLSL